MVSQSRTNGEEEASKNKERHLGLLTFFVLTKLWYENNNLFAFIELSFQKIILSLYM